MNITSLQKSCQGIVAVPGDERYAEFVYGELWNRLIPERGPAVVVQVVDENDVIAVVLFARENMLKVTVRGGGHNWCQPSLRNGGVLIDLTLLNKVISLDVAGCRAVVQPIISNREIQRILNAKGLAYPSGHCPQVKLSGYLLGGGMSWNQGVWGHGNESVEAIELVTADGKLITASAEENVEYFWAARGAGYGFFGVVTRYHLKLYPLPSAMHGCGYFYALEDAPAVVRWLGEIAPRISPSVELSAGFLTAPADLQERTAAQNGKVCLIAATAFADTAEEARASLSPLDDCPLIGKCLARDPAKPVTFEELFDASGALWPEGQRARVKAIFSNSEPGELARIAGRHIIESPSPTTVVFFSIFTGPNVPAPLPDAALSMSARVYGGPWTMWKDAADDAANTTWHERWVELMKPHIVGYYIGETDPIANSAEAVGAFAPANWKRLAELRDKHDPDGVFFGYSDGVTHTI